MVVGSKAQLAHRTHHVERLLLRVTSVHGQVAQVHGTRVILLDVHLCGGGWPRQQGLRGGSRKQAAAGIPVTGVTTLASACPAILQRCRTRGRSSRARTSRPGSSRSKPDSL